MLQCDCIRFVGVMTIDYGEKIDGISEYGYEGIKYRDGQDDAKKQAPELYPHPAILNNHETFNSFFTQ